MNDHYDPETDTNRIIEILDGLSEKLIVEHKVEADKVARAYLGAALQLHMQCYDSIPAAAAWVRGFADALESDADTARTH